MYRRIVPIINHLAENEIRIDELGLFLIKYLPTLLIKQFVHLKLIFYALFFDA